MQACKPGSVSYMCMTPIIYLGLTLPLASNDLPAGLDEQPFARSQASDAPAYLVFQHVRFTLLRMSPSGR